MLERLKKNLNEISAGTILDVGIGRGQFAWIMAENFKDYNEIIGIDINPKILQKAEKNLSQFKVKFELMSGDKLQFQDDFFDTVSIAQVFHHIPTKENIKKILMEMKRVLKPGGIFIIKEMFSDNHKGAGQAVVDYHHFIADIDRILGKNHFRTFKKSEILDIASDLNLHSLKEFEFLLDENINKDENQIKDFIDKIDKRVESVIDYAEYETMKHRAEEIKDKVKSLGLAYEREVIIIGRKL